MTQTISREDIAEIYDQLARLEAGKVLDLVQSNSPGWTSDETGERLDRALAFRQTADDVREIEAMKPLRPDIRIPHLWVRAETNNW